MSKIAVISLKRREMYHLLLHQPGPAQASPARLPNICIDDDRAEQRSHATCWAGKRVPGGLHTCARGSAHVYYVSGSVTLNSTAAPQHNNTNNRMLRWLSCTINSPHVPS